MENLVLFAQEILERAAAEISTGFTTLVEGFGGDEGLRRIVHEEGVAAALRSDAIVHKGPNREVVTAADQRAEIVLREAVAARYPAHSITGEEFGSVERGEWRWVFDPIDGTSAMIRCALAQAYGLALPDPAPGFGVMIGILEGDTPTAGLVGRLVPEGPALRLGDVWVGVAGQPSLVNGGPVTPPAPTPIDHAVVACTVPEVMFSRQPGLFQAIERATVHIERDQNCIGYMGLLGAGIDVVVERDLGVYDVAAVVPILAGAGVRVTDHGGAPLRFDTSSRRGEYAVVAAMPTLHAEILGIMRAATTGSPGEEGSSYSEGYARRF